MPSARFAQAVETIKARWPTVGAYADHPLGEWFHEYVAQKSWARRYRPRQAGSPILLLAVLFLCGPLGLLLYLVLRLFLVNKRPHKILSQPACIFDVRRASLLQELWLTGISYQDLAAIEVSLAISRPLRRHMWWLAFSVWTIVAGVILVPLLAWVMKDGGIPAVVWVLIGVSTVAWFMAFFFCNNQNKLALQALKGMAEETEQRARGKVKEFTRQLVNIFVAVIVAVIFFTAMAFLENGVLIAIYLAVAIGFVSVYMFYAIYQFQGHAVQELFLETSARGRDDFAEIIYKQSERDMPRK